MKKNDYILSALAGLSAFLLQILIAMTANFNGLSQRAEALVSHAAARLMTSPGAMGWVGFYVVLGVFVHAAPVALALKSLRDLQRSAPKPVAAALNQRGIPQLAALAVLAAMFAWNGWLFPESFEITGLSEGHSSAWWQLTSLTLITGLAAGLPCLWLAFCAKKKFFLGATAASCILLGGAAFTSTSIEPVRRDKPDIIMIGIDSLRPDHIGSAGGTHDLTPAISAFRDSAIVFDNAFTTMGRTFVAYMSVLSGHYPTVHGARENLYPRNLVRTEQLLPQRLKSSGYSTIFGLDEVRFATIDKDFGFDEVISPPSGVVELLAGTLLDTAGTNLIQLIPGSHVVMPHVAANRALHDSYVPGTQVRKISSSVRSIDPTRPLFLLAHFTMPHTPFARGRWPAEDLSDDFADSPPQYRKALSIADTQVASLLHNLKSAGRLDDAIVVVFSDHGEGLGMAKDEWTLAGDPLRRFATARNFGHGTIALEDSQSRIFLAAQRFENGRPAWRPREETHPASLVDLTPTMMEASRVAYDANDFDGVALVGADGITRAPDTRPIFVESGIFGRSLATLHIDKTSVASEFSHLYRVTDNLKIELIPQHVETLLRSKQRGVIIGQHGVAFMPDAMKEGCWLLRNYADRTQSCFEDPAENSFVDASRSLLCRHFSADRHFSEQWCH